MRIKVLGDSPVANGLRGLIEREGFQLVQSRPTFTLEIMPTDSGVPILDGVDSEIERVILSALAELTPSGQVLIQRAGGNRDDRRMWIKVPADEAEGFAVQRAVIRALHQLRRAQPPTQGWRTWLGDSKSR